MNVTKQTVKWLVNIWLVGIAVPVAIHASPASLVPRVALERGDSIALYFQQVREATAKHEHLWNKDIYGPLLVVDPETREAFANEPDKEGRLTLDKGLYRGILPREVPVANTDTRWSSKHWAMLVLPLPANRHDRVDLMTHELFHSAQPSLGFTPRREENQHLDLKEGRIYLRLEIKALEAALKAPRLRRAEEHLRNALLFRKFRHQVYRGSEMSENQLELLEGLATYTGQMMSGRDKWEWRAYLLRRVEQFIETPTFVRSFAYETVPVYGFFLYQKDNRWNLKVDNETMLTELFSDTFGMERRILLQSYIRQVADEYDGRRIVEEETRRAASMEEELDRYRELFFDLPHLEIRLEDMKMSFDPRNLIPLDEDEGTVYPTVEISDNWGTLTVSEGGALLRTDWRWVIVSEPLEITGRRVAGEGWVIDLNEGYFVEEATEGVFLLSKKKGTLSAPTGNLPLHE